MNNWLKLQNKTAIITGAGSGIGKTIAKALHAQGCNLFLADFNEQGLKDFCSTFHGNIPAMKRVDVTSKEEISDFMKFVDGISSEKEISDASILINAAGILRDAFLSDTTEEAYDQVLDTNLKGTFLACQAFCAPHRIEQLLKNGEGGSIVNLGSVISERGNIGQANYAASKGGVVGLTRALAKEMAYLSTKIKKDQHLITTTGNSTGNSIGDANIRVNAILPGVIETPMTAGIPEVNKKRILSQIPLRRFGAPEDVANMALFLSSEERSGYVTGECWECSGAIAI